MDFVDIGNIAEGGGLPGKPVSLWIATTPQTDYPALEGDIKVDVAVLGGGEVVGWKGEKVAVYRDEGGTVHACSAVCTHTGCLVRWNGAERSWDCPCHGSRFDHEGKVIQGPANQDLEAGKL